MALAAGALHAATIRGTVSDDQTGHLLARALVREQPVDGTPGTARSVRTDRYGNFEFLSLAPGDYLITASRRYFMTVEYGQKRWNSAGYPVAVAEGDAPFLSIRMFRFSAIAGTVVDENDVGLPEHEVAAYRNTRPPQLVTSAKADERGVYRIYGLEPGSYLVRTLPEQSEEGSYLPTFARETQIVEQAFPVEVSINQQVNRIDVRPAQGTLYSLSVEIGQPYPAPPITVTLVSDMGRKTVHSYSYRFTGLPRGQYQIFAEAPTTDHPGLLGAYTTLSVTQDSSINLGMGEMRPTGFTFQGAPRDAVESGAIQVLARRKDLAGAGPAEVLPVVRGGALLAPGPWQLALAPMTAYYVTGFSGLGYGFLPNQHAEGWNDIEVRGYGSSARFTLSANPGSVHGTVKSGSSGPAVGAPVFLEPADLPPDRRVTHTYVTRTDMHGRYKFSGLAPGNYRVLSSFEYRMPDSATMANVGTRPFKVDERSDVERDLDLYVIQ